MAESMLGAGVGTCAFAESNPELLVHVIAVRFIYQSFQILRLVCPMCGHWCWELARHIATNTVPGIQVRLRLVLFEYKSVFI